jgi:hypothetical protein
MKGGRDREGSLKKRHISVSIGKSPSARSRNSGGSGSMLVLDRATLKHLEWLRVERPLLLSWALV